MEGLTLGEIAKAIALLAAIITPAVAALRWATKPLREIEKRVCALEELNELQEWKIKDSIEQRRLLMRGMYAVLEGLKELNCNGPVTAAKDEIEDYLKERPFK